VQIQGGAGRHRHRRVDAKRAGSWRCATHGSDTSLQRSRADRRRAGVGVGAGERQRAAGDGQGTASTADRAAKGAATLTVRVVGPLRAKVDPEPFRLAIVWAALLKVTAPLSITAAELESNAGEETVKAALLLTVTLPVTVPVLIVLPVPFTVIPPVLKVPAA